MPISDRAAEAALTSLIILQGIMLASLFAGVPPHPPSEVVPFGMAPFLAAAISAAAAAIWLGSTASVEGRVLIGLAVLMALVSFGPQKVIDPAISRIWPAVFTAWVAIGTLGFRLVRRLQAS